MATNDRDVSPADIVRLNEGRTGGATTLSGEIVNKLNQIAGTSGLEFKEAHESAVANQA